MYYHVCHRLAYRLMLQCVVISNNTFHIERARQVTCQFWQHGPYKVEKVVLPCSIIRKTVAISLVTNQMRLINIVHTHVVKPFPYRQAFTEHQQTRHRQSFHSILAIDCITSKLF